VHDTFREWCSYCRPVAAEPDLATARSRGAKPRDVAQANSRRRHAPVPIAGTADSAYKKWNAAVAGAIFTQAKAHAPVYLDMNDETLAQIGRAVGLDADADAEAHLVEAVRDTLSMQPPAKKKDAFRWHLNRLANWKNGEPGSASIDNPPPVLALLALFSRAAERMGHDESLDVKAYYSRLAELLGVEVALADRLSPSYQRDAEELWGALSGWLDALGGRAGVSTVNAVGHRHVGLAISQALLRDADRKKLQDFLIDTHLEPGGELHQVDLERILGGWLKRQGTSHTLSRLWSTQVGRGFVLEAARVALRQWDGSIATEDERAAVGPRLALTARISTRPLDGSKITLNFALLGRLADSDASSEYWRVASADGTPEVEMEPSSDRVLLPAGLVDVDARALLEGEIVLAPGEGSARGSSARHPTPLVVLRSEPALGLYVEADRVRLGERHIVLFSSSSPQASASVWPNLASVIGEVAKPGFALWDDVKGLPPGWSAYRDVIVVRSSHATDAMLFDPLLPLDSISVVVEGSLQLPGSRATWHAGGALNVHAIAREASSMRLTVSRTDEGSVVFERESTEQEVAGEIPACELQPGTYEVGLQAEPRRSYSSVKRIVSLVDSDSISPWNPLGQVSLEYSPRDPVGALSAFQQVAEEDYCAGEQTVTAGDGPMLAPVWWRNEGSNRSPARLTRPASSESCAIRGDHHSDVEIIGKRQRETCRDCRRVKWGPLKGRLKSDRPASRDQAPVLLSSQLGGEGSLVNSGMLLDALVWMRTGSMDHFSRLIRQAVDDAVTPHRALRELESIGYINVRRDLATFAPIEWCVVAPSLYELANGECLVGGAWSISEHRRLAEAVDAETGQLKVDDTGWIERRTIAGLDRQDLKSLAEEMNCVFLEQAGPRLLRSLPPMSQLLNALTVESAEGIFDAEWFNPATTSWTTVESIAEAGAYRLNRGFTKRYYVRTAEDLQLGTVRRGDAFVVKHLASRGRPLIGYDASNELLYVPLGAELPGLYGRALALMAGTPPQLVEGKALLAYANVGVEQSVIIYRLLGETP